MSATRASAATRLMSACEHEPVFGVAGRFLRARRIPEMEYGASVERGSVGQERVRQAG